MDNRILLRGRTIKLNAVQNVAAARTASMRERKGFLYKHLFIAFAGVTVAQMTEIRVLANDKVIMRGDGDYFASIAFYENFDDADTTGILPVSFVRPDMKTPDGEALTGINVGSVDGNGFAVAELSVEIDIAAGAAAPKLDIFADISDPLPGGPGLIRRVSKFSRAAPVVGQNDISDLALLGQKVTTRLFLNRLTLRLDPALIKEFRLMNNGREELRSTPAINEVTQRRDRRVPVAGYTIIDPSQAGLSGNFFNLATPLEEFRLELTLQGALPAAFDYFAEFIGALE